MMNESQPPPIQEIARLAGVSVNEALRVLLGQPGVDELVRRKVLDVMQATGYHPAASHKPAVDTLGTIGIVSPGPLISDYMGGVTDGIMEVAHTHNYATNFHIQGPETSEDMIRFLGPGGVDGIIMMVPFQYNEVISTCHQYKRPYVLVDYQGDDDIAHVPTVEVENRQGIINVMNYLVKLGHRRIAFITGELRIISAVHRFQGYKEALKQAGIDFDPELVREGNWMHPMGYEHGKHLLQLPNPPTAICCANDLTAFGVYQAIREAGKQIGKDISVTGFDDIDMAGTVSPPLTTVRQPVREMGRVAAQMLLMQLHGEIPEPLHAKLDTELIVRQSTAPVKG
ncbi:MAG: LacI family DNA-binding transcriptional regulator [Anaerolineae bacterium]